MSGEKGYLHYGAPAGETYDGEALPEQQDEVVVFPVGRVPALDQRHGCCATAKRISRLGGFDNGSYTGKDHERKQRVRDGNRTGPMESSRWDSQRVPEFSKDRARAERKAAEEKRSP